MRGIKLTKNDKVVSMAVIHHVDVTSEERSAYFKMRRAITGDDLTPDDDLPCLEIPCTGHLMDCPVVVTSII